MGLPPTMQGWEERSVGTIQSGVMLENGACMRNFLEKCRQRVKALRDNGLRIFSREI